MNVLTDSEEQQAAEWERAREIAREMTDTEYMKEKYRDILVQTGIVKETADRMAGVASSVTRGPEDDPTTGKAREDYRDTLIKSGMTREMADRIAGMRPVMENRETGSSESQTESLNESPSPLHEDEPGIQRGFIKEDRLGGRFR